MNHDTDFYSLPWYYLRILSYRWPWRLLLRVTISVRSVIDVTTNMESWERIVSRKNLRRNAAGPFIIVLEKPRSITANPCRSQTRWSLKPHALFGPNPFVISIVSINELWKSTFKRNNKWMILPSCGKTVGLSQEIWPTVCMCDIQDRRFFILKLAFVYKIWSSC